MVDKKIILMVSLAFVFSLSFLSNTVHAGELIQPTVSLTTEGIVTQDLAALHSTITDMGTADEVDVWFEYKKENEETWSTTPEKTLTTSDTFSSQITGLDSNTTYEFRAVADGDGDIVYSGIVTFTTLEIPEEIIEIRDWYDLDDISECKDCYYKLMNYIDQDSAGYDELVDIEDGWNPIDDFSGILDGQGNYIQGLQVEGSVSGLFSYTYAEAYIKNLGVIDANLTGNTHLGIISGNGGGIFENVYTSGDIYAGPVEDRKIRGYGGIIGHGTGKTVILNSQSNVDIYGDTENSWSAGGLAGDVGQFFNINNSYFTGSIEAHRDVGGLIGYGGGFHSGENIYNSYSIGELYGEQHVSGLMGFDSRYNTEAVNSYWNYETTDEYGITTGIGESRSIDDMTYPYGTDTYVGWDFDDVWLGGDHDIVTDRFNNSGYPALQVIEDFVAEEYEPIVDEPFLDDISNFLNNLTMTGYFLSSPTLYMTVVAIIIIIGVLIAYYTQAIFGGLTMLILVFLFTYINWIPSWVGLILIVLLSFIIYMRIGERD